MPLQLEPITPALGAKVHIAAKDVLREGVPAQLLAALERHGVLLFPQINMDDDTFLALTAALGEKHEVKVTNDGSAPSNKGIFRVARDKDDKTQREFILGNDFWHMDGMNYPVPVKATLLKCERAPAEGGDTGFASLHAAWEALPADRQRALEPLRVGHCLSAALRRLHDAPTPEDFARWDAIFPGSSTRWSGTSAMAAPCCSSAPPQTTSPGWTRQRVGSCSTNCMTGAPRSASPIDTPGRTAT